jgi:UDP-N-acetylglucosamine 2-epimerase (non-hydrolysing)
VRLLKEAYLVITDSGGIQEEAPALGKPVLVCREVTERPEAVAAGGVRLVGSDPELLSREAERLWNDPAAYRAMAAPRFPYGDGQAARRIAGILGRDLP